ncbi:MAG: DUF4082 domain-containing protein [Chitinophagaceae bacterium]|nr:DUF4082 domain-containing protein [Chitinophagaceae bacterium]
MKRKLYPLSSCSYLLFAIFLLLLFPVLPSFSQTYTINFTGSPPAPGSGAANNNDNGGTVGIEAGVKFRVTQIGTITAIRFYKGNTDQGAHVGSLWLSDGTLLGQVTFTGETGAGGWKEQAFTTPITVSPGNTYVATYYSDEGYYAVTNNYFTSNVGTNPLIAICNCDGTNPFNGVYDYTNGPVFPGSSFNASNYWVDVRFAPTFPLPVTLSDLKAVTSNKDVTVSWKTSSENNNKGFEVQRSNNGADWYSLGFVNGFGESTVIKDYSYTDRNLAPGLYYYRLNQKDFDGRSKISPVVTANVAGKGQVSLFQNYPNPFKGTSAIRFDLPTTQKIRLSVLDITGREVRVLTDKLSEAGTHQVSISSDGLGRQLYIIRLQTESGILTRKMLVE